MLRMGPMHFLFCLLRTALFLLLLPSSLFTALGKGAAYEIIIVITVCGKVPQPGTELSSLHPVSHFILKTTS